MELALATCRRTYRHSRDTAPWRGADDCIALPWEIRHIVADGNVVMTERVDHFLVGDNRISVPCMGVFELRNGKIAAWRDYWDRGQFEVQLPSPAPSGQTAL